MGIYDREYLREEPAGMTLRAPRTAVAWLLVVNLALFAADLLFSPNLRSDGLGAISGPLSLGADLWAHPWRLWQLLTAGFVHDPHVIAHVAFNMLGLWFLGRDVERQLGRAEFFRVYLLLIVASSLGWLVVENLLHPLAAGQRAPRMLGASGAITGLMVLFVARDPTRGLYVFGMGPIPGWLVCVLYVTADLMRGYADATGGTTTVAWQAHLAGALTALVYYRSGVFLGRWLPLARWPRSRPSLKVHQPAADDDDAGLSARVDAILEKISVSGESSLTPDERRTLERASRHYQRRRQ